VGGFVGIRDGLVVLGFDVIGIRVGLTIEEAVIISQDPMVSCSGKKGHHNNVSGICAKLQSSE
jgi:hypothetical protein